MCSKHAGNAPAKTASPRCLETLRGGVGAGGAFDDLRHASSDRPETAAVGCRYQVTSTGKSASRTEHARQRSARVRRRLVASNGLSPTGRFLPTPYRGCRVLDMSRVYWRRRVPARVVRSELRRSGREGRRRQTDGLRIWPLALSCGQSCSPVHAGQVVMATRYAIPSRYGDTGQGAASRARDKRPSCRVAPDTPLRKHCLRSLRTCAAQFGGDYSIAALPAGNGSGVAARATAREEKVAASLRPRRHRIAGMTARPSCVDGPRSSWDGTLPPPSRRRRPEVRYTTFVPLRGTSVGRGR